jgi:hypothetical protein
MKPEFEYWNINSTPHVDSCPDNCRRSPCLFTKKNKRSLTVASTRKKNAPLMPAPTAKVSSNWHTMKAKSMRKGRWPAPWMWDPLDHR